MNGDLGLFPNDLEFEIEFNIFLKLQDIEERIIENNHPSKKETSKIIIFSPYRETIP